MDFLQWARKKAALKKEEQKQQRLSNKTLDAACETYAEKRRARIVDHAVRIAARSTRQDPQRCTTHDSSNINSLRLY